MPHRFSDYPEFTPNLSPRDIFVLGSFGGTYWRPIHSSITSKNYVNAHRKLPVSWWQGIPEDYLVSPDYDVAVNRYHVKVGSSLEDWEMHHWITAVDPYGWVQWYCHFFNGRRTSDDERQIHRWQGIAGKNGRFRKWLVAQIVARDGAWNDANISPKIRQTLQHWGYKLTKQDFNAATNSR